MISKNPNQNIFWQEHLDKYRASGQPRSKYCRENGLKVHQLAYYIGRRSIGGASKKNVFARVVSPPTVPQPPKRFAARLMFAGGVVLEIEPGTDPVWLSGIITHVGGRL